MSIIIIDIYHSITLHRQRQNAAQVQKEKKKNQQLQETAFADRQTANLLAWVRLSVTSCIKHVPYAEAMLFLCCDELSAIGQNIQRQGDNLPFR